MYPATSWDVKPVQTPKSRSPDEEVHWTRDGALGDCQSVGFKFVSAGPKKNECGDSRTACYGTAGALCRRST